MNEDTLEFPAGQNTALALEYGELSFDDLHRLRWIVRRELRTFCGVTPKRILGCLQDDGSALLALLFVTEVADYIPINPALSAAEMSRIADGAGADLAFVSPAFRTSCAQNFPSLRLLDWEDLLKMSIDALLGGETAEPDEGWSGEGRLILHTSGSTGTPKRVPISISSVNASAKNIAAGHGLRQDDHALNALPTFHIGALVDVLLAPFAAKGKVSITDQRSPDGLVRALRHHRPTWIQVVPTLLRRLVEDISNEDLADAGQSLRFIRSISAPVPADLKAQAEEAFGCPVIEMYGMTETAGQIATVPRPPASSPSGSVGHPVGVEVAIIDGHGNTLLQGQTGEVCVRGPSVFDGYEGTARDQVFFENWFRTGDLGRLDQGGALFLQGRLKEMINVGGEKVSPHEVETAALEMPDVIEAAAYSVPHSTLGEQVGLAIATRSAVDSQQVKDFLEPRLATFKRPNRIAHFDQLPRLANAKVDRVLLKRTAQKEWEERQDAAGHARPQYSSSEASKIAFLWSKTLKCRLPESGDDFFDMGGDSLTATEFLLALEKTLKRQISPNQLFEAPTFDGLVSAVSVQQPHVSTTVPRPIRFIQEKTAGWPGQVVVSGGLLKAIGSLKPGHPLFWSSQAHYEVNAIVETIAKRRPLYVTASLRRFKRRTEADFECVGAQLAEEIMAIQPSGPIALGGFCGGAWVMHHAAEVLMQRGRDIRVFISFDYWPKRTLAYPVVHCMSDCPINSARVHYGNHTLTESLLHTKGTETLIVGSKHRFDANHIAPHAAKINAILDGRILDVAPATSDPQAWDLDQRRAAPKARICLTKTPFLYPPMGRVSMGVEVTNISNTVWPKTLISGLSVQVDLVNLDGHMRKANLAFKEFEDDIQPGECTKFMFDLTLPDKRIPMWLTCCMVSQGLGHFRTRAAGARRILVIPNPFRTTASIGSD